MSLLLSFQTLQIAVSDGGSCDEDFLEIGPQPHFKICGNHSTPYISQRGHVWITFQSNYRRSARGFELLYVMGNSKACCDFSTLIFFSPSPLNFFKYFLRQFFCKAEKSKV